MITNIRKVVARECAQLCKRSSLPLEAVRVINLNLLIVNRQLKKDAPLLYSIMKSACKRPRLQGRTKRNVLTMAASLLLKGREKM